MAGFGRKRAISRCISGFLPYFFQRAWLKARLLRACVHSHAVWNSRLRNQGNPNSAPEPASISRGEIIDDFADFGFIDRGTIDLDHLGDLRLPEILFEF